MNPGMSEHRTNWSDDNLGPRYYGDFTGAKGDKNGEYYREGYDS